MQPADCPSTHAEPSKAPMERCAGKPLSAALSREERLRGRTAIARLMKEGKWSRCGSLKYCFLAGNGESCNRVMVAVPKRLFKRAVKRNMLKRRLREAYRTQKYLLAVPGGDGQGGVRVDLLLQYNSAEILPSDSIRGMVAEVLAAVVGKMARNAEEKNDSEGAGAAIE